MNMQRAKMDDTKFEHKHGDPNYFLTHAYIQNHLGKREDTERNQLVTGFVYLILEVDEAVIASKMQQ